ncbi:hypothetical protein JCM10207_003781 [Rhodosporidiobolus poonsookiae]
MASAPRPFLPVDLILVVAEEALASIWGQERVDMACALSLCCRQLRRVGQAALYRCLAFGLGEKGGAQKAAAAQRSPYLASLVRNLEYETTWTRSTDRPTRVASDAISRDRQVFQRLLECCPNLVSVSISDLGGADAVWATQSLATSLASSFIGDVHLSVPADARCALLPDSLVEVEALDIAAALVMLPSLRHLTTNAFPSVAWPPADQPARRLRLTTLHTYFSSGPSSTPSDPPRLPPLLHSLDPATLRVVDIGWSPVRPSFLTYILSADLPNLTNLAIHAAPEPPRNQIPPLVQAITRLPSLRVFSLTSTYSLAEENTADAADLAALSLLFDSFPSTVQFVFLQTSRVFTVADIDCRLPRGSSLWRRCRVWTDPSQTEVLEWTRKEHDTKWTIS